MRVLLMLVCSCYAFGWVIAFLASGAPWQVPWMVCALTMAGLSWVYALAEGGGHG